MEFKDLVKIRQSDRKYLDKPIEREKIVQCLESARLSPSSNNSQPWKFIIIDEPELRKNICNETAGLGMNHFIHQAPIIIAIVLEKQNLLSSIGTVIQDKEYSLLDMGIAVNQFCLQASDLGLGTCIIGWFKENNIKKLLNVPAKLRLPLLISVGYTDNNIRQKGRKKIEQMSNWNSY